MGADVKTNNQRLRELVEGAGLIHPVALTIFNRGLGVRGLKESTWKGYFCDHSTTRFRNFNDDLMEHAEKVLGPMQNKSCKSGAKAIPKTVTVDLADIEFLISPGVGHGELSRGIRQ